MIGRVAGRKAQSRWVSRCGSILPVPTKTRYAKLPIMSSISRLLNRSIRLRLIQDKPISRIANTTTYQTNNQTFHTHNNQTKQTTPPHKQTHKIPPSHTQTPPYTNTTFTIHSIKTKQITKTLSFTIKLPLLSNQSNQINNNFHQNTYTTQKIIHNAKSITHHNNLSNKQANISHSQ